jgi:hypothetical protein
MGKFTITEEERRRILNLHETRTKNHYLIEQDENDEVLKIKKLVIDPPNKKSYVELEKEIEYGKEIAIDHSKSNCPKGTYTQDKIPNGCSGTFKLNGKTITCSSNGCVPEGVKILNTVTTSSSSFELPYLYIKLKKPIDGFDKAIYDKKTGEIRGYKNREDDEANGKENVFLKIQAGKDGQWVKNWLRRNKIRTSKVMQPGVELGPLDSN